MNQISSKNLQVRLIRPSLQYRKSFLTALWEFDKDKSWNMEPKYKEAAKDPDKFIKRLLGFAKGKDLPPTYVPDTFYWLVEGNKYIGRVDIRHYLTPALRRKGGNIGYAIRPTQRGKGFGNLILKLVLPKAAKLGIKRALLTVDSKNTTSRKIIEKHGGKLIKHDKVAEPGFLRFWVPTGKIAKRN